MCVDAQGPDGAGNASIQKDALNNIECFDVFWEFFWERLENLAMASFAVENVHLWTCDNDRANLCNYNSSTNHLDTVYISCRFLQYFVLELVISHSQLSNGPMVLLHSNCSTSFWGSVPSAEDSFGDCRRDSVLGCRRWLHSIGQKCDCRHHRQQQQQQQQNK